MKSKAVDDETWVLVFEQGDEAFGGLESFAREQGLTAAGLTGIGAFREATLGYFDWESKEYEELPVAEQAEVLSLVGDVAEQDGRPVVHAHVVLGLRDGSTRGGHLLRGIVRPTLEVVLRHSPARLRKRHDPASGLALIDLDT